MLIDFVMQYSFQESLGYRLTGSEGDIGSWGHEYVRNLAGEIAEESTVLQVRKQIGHD